MTLKKNIYISKCSKCSKCLCSNGFEELGSPESILFYNIRFLQEFYNPRRQKPSQSLGKCS